MSEINEKTSQDDLPEPISVQDRLLHNIIDGTPDIEDLIPKSRQEIYLKYIALNGSSGQSVNVVQTKGTSETDVMSQKAVSDELNKLGTASLCDTGISEGNVPIINLYGKLDNSIIPSLAITDTFTANNEEEMLNLQGAEKGDICVRTDENKTYILDENPNTNTRALTRTNLSDWIELQTPTDQVSSVNSKKGNVVLTADDIDTYSKSEIDSKLPNIVQETGTSESDIMSQKAVSTMCAIGEGVLHQYDTDNTSIAFGKGARIRYGNNVILGNQAMSNSENSIAIGASSFSVGGISLGNSANANRNCICIGTSSRTASQGHSIAIGSNTKGNGTNSISIGNAATTTQNSSIAIGANSSITSIVGSPATYSIAIGSQATSTNSYSVALGANSTATEDSVISVGDGSDNSNYGTRKIVNVKDPENEQDVATKKYVDDKIATSSSINVVQEIGTSETDVMSQKSVTNNTCFGEGASSSNDTSVSLGKSAYSSISSCSIGNNSNSSYQSIAIGEGSTTRCETGVSIGYNSKCNSDYDGSSAKKHGNISIGAYTDTNSEWSTNIGYGTSCNNADYSVSLGAHSVANEPYTISVGDGASISDTSTRRIVNVKDPVNSQDVTTKNYVDGVVLYNNSAGTSGTITLSENYTNYKTIKIYYTRYNNDIVNSSELNTDITNTVHLFIYSTTEPFSKMLFMTCNLIFSGRTVTLEKNIQSIIGLIAGETSITSKTASDSILYVNKIIGYKY